MKNIRLTLEERKNVVLENEGQIILAAFDYANYAVNALKGFHKEMEEKYGKAYVQQRYNNYFEFYYNIAMNQYLDENFSGHDETVNGVDLSKYLKDIRNSVERMMRIMYIKDKQVVESLTMDIYPDRKRECINDKVKKEIQRRASENGCDIYYVQNNTKKLFNAGTDYLAMGTIDNLFGEMEGAKLLDWGEVCAYDYFSYNQCSNDIKEKLNKCYKDFDYHSELFSKRLEHERNLGTRISFDEVMERRKSFK